MKAAAILIACSLTACSVTVTNPDASTDAGEHALPPSCAVFHDLCVTNEDLSAAAQECHEFMHHEALTEALCATKKDACLAACTPPVDGGADSASADAAAAD